MKSIARPAIIGALISGVVLAGHALYFYSTSIALADVLIFLLVVASWSYLLKQAASGDRIFGDDSTGDRQFIKESSAFHVQLGHEMSDQLSSAHTELGNTQAILGDAIIKLVSNFIAISDGVRELSEHTSSFSKQVRQLIDDVRSTLASSEGSAHTQNAGETTSAERSNRHVRDMLANFIAFNDTVNQNALELNAINSKVEQNVLVVISSLQFQDMSSQLIEHARMRMTALQEIANEMGKAGDSLTHREYLEQIAAYNRLLQKHVMSLDRNKANPVAQKDFGTGDIELF